MKKDEVGRHIKDEAKKQRFPLSKLAERIGISNVTLSNYITGKTKIPVDVLTKISDELRVDIASLLGLEDKSNINKAVKVPVLGQIACGEPILAEENIDSYAIDSTDFVGDGWYYLEAKGESMQPTIPDGSMVLVQPQDTIEDGEIGAFIFTSTYEATIKRSKKVGDKLLLLPDNKDFEPIVADKDNPVKVLGRVREVRFTVR